jgi:hypothetical protein
MAWLLGILLISLVLLPIPVMAGTSFSWGQSDSGSPSIILAGVSSCLETQMLGEKPDPPAPAGPALMPKSSSSQFRRDGATVNLPFNTEMNISVLYKRDPGSVPEAPQRLADNPLYMKYSMDYRLLPNLRVGLNTYLYRQSEDPLGLQRQYNKQFLGIGPQLKYDLGRWSFLLKSQVESGDNRNQREDLQNWFRVWYAF